jgi:hypothetical protein
VRLAYPIKLWLTQARTAVSRYSELSERTYRRHFNDGIGFEPINEQVIGMSTQPESLQILSVDCTFNEKSGRATPELDWFYNGKTQQVERGLEWSVVAVVDLQQQTAYALSAQQTEAGIAARVEAAKAAGKGCGNRVDFYLGHLAYCQPYVPPRVNYVVADSFYSKRKWVDGVLKLGWHCIGKLRQDADLKYLYHGSRRPGPGRQRKYDGKVNPQTLNLNHFKHEATLDDGTELWTAIVWSVSLARRIRLVCSIRRTSQGMQYALLFSTDVGITAAEIVRFYRARFQIEFLFRDARQFTGMVDSQSRNSNALDTHVNASLTALNLAKSALRKELALSDQAAPDVISFSIASLKCRALNGHLFDLFIDLFDLDPTSIKLNPNYQKLLHYGSLRACSS